MLREVVPGPLSQTLFEIEARYMAPGTQSVALFSRIALDHGEGALLYDVDGNRYIDLLAGVGVASLGYNHPAYVAALSPQLARAHVRSFTAAAPAGLLTLLADLAPGDVVFAATGVTTSLPSATARSRKAPSPAPGPLQRAITPAPAVGCFTSRS